MGQITLLYHAKAVGPVCRRVAAVLPDKLKVVCDRDQSALLEDDMIVRWDSTRTTHALECQLASTVKVSRNKSESRRLLAELAPPTWFKREDVEVPCIIRPKRHHAASNFNICEDAKDVNRAIAACGKGWYASPILVKSTEWRVYVFQGHVISVSKRVCDDPDLIAWNVGPSSRMFKVQRKKWPILVVRQAILAAQRLGLQWAAIDVVVTTSDEVFVFEANTAPGLVRTARSLPLIAKAFAWAGDNPEFNEQPLLEGTTWKAFLHPALRKAE